MTTRLVMLAVVLAAVCPVPSALALLRAQNVSICDPTTGSYAGYFHPEHVETKGYFYWFFPSRNDPATDPVVLWMTGGPGCSSQLALLTENGPCGVAKDGSTTIRNGYSWTNNASVIWIDQPAGVGYSYGKPSDYDHNEAQVSQDMVSFLDEFMAYFSDYASNPFYVFGESYGGHYVPATAFAVWNASKTGTGPKINLKGLGLVFGIVFALFIINFFCLFVCFVFACVASSSQCRPPSLESATAWWRRRSSMRCTRTWRTTTASSRSCPRACTR